MIIDLRCVPYTDLHGAIGLIDWRGKLNVFGGQIFSFEHLEFIMLDTKCNYQMHFKQRKESSRTEMLSSPKWGKNLVGGNGKQVFVNRPV